MLMTAWALRGQAAPLFAWTGSLPCFLRFFRQVVCHALQRHTAPSLHLPLFLEETFLRTLTYVQFTMCTAGQCVKVRPAKCLIICSYLLCCVLCRSSSRRVIKQTRIGRLRSRGSTLSTSLSNEITRKHSECSQGWKLVRFILYTHV